MATNHIRAWRKHRGLTQSQLGARIGTKEAMVSLLEAGERRLSPMWLRRVALALGVPVGAVLEHPPCDGCAEFLDAWAAVPEADRPRAMAVVRCLTSAVTRATSLGGC